MRITDPQSLFQVVFMALIKLVFKLSSWPWWQSWPRRDRWPGSSRRERGGATPCSWEGSSTGLWGTGPPVGRDRIWLTMPLKPSIALATRHWKAIIKTQWTSMQVQPPSSKASSSSQITMTIKKIAIKSSRQHHHSYHGQDNVNGTSVSSWASFLLASQTKVAGITYWIPVPAKDPVIVTFFSSYQYCLACPCHWNHWKVTVKVCENVCYGDVDFDLMFTKYHSLRRWCCCL